MKRAGAKAKVISKVSQGSRRIQIERSDPEGETTLTQQAYQRLRADILDGAFEPGKPLRLEALKERYNLSFSPLREALNRLQSERLVVASALRGFRMAELSLPQMWDAIETRILIEGEALSRAIERGGDDWEASVIGAFHALSLCAQRIGAANKRRTKVEEEQLEGRHREFHASLISACGSTWLIDFSTQLYEQTERYRRPLLGPNYRLPKRDIHAEHEAIMKAALSRQTKNATQLLSDHYRKTGEIIERNFEKAA
jgi:GntR family transcriptional regulator, carbon starvation induced regulator